MQLMSKTLRNNVGWAQVIKQFITMVSGIDTKMQEEMDKGGREHHIMTEYSRWVQIMNEKFPDPAVLSWLMFTTGTHNIRVTGKYIYRMFCDGLRVVNRDLNTEWVKFSMKEFRANRKKNYGPVFVTGCTAKETIWRWKTQHQYILNDNGRRRESVYTFSSLWGRVTKFWSLGNQSVTSSCRTQRTWARETRVNRKVPPPLILSLPSSSHVFTLLIPGLSRKSM